MNAAIIIGHDQSSQGAVTYNHITEYQFNSFIAESILSLHKFKLKQKYAKFQNLKVLNRNAGWPYLCDQIKGCDVSIELHLNSFSKAALGVETLYIESDQPSYDFAKTLSFAIASQFKSKLRHDDGTLSVVIGDRGYHNISVVKKAGVKIAVLVEPTFISHETAESRQLIEYPLSYASLIYGVLENFSKGF